MAARDELFAKQDAAFHVAGLRLKGGPLRREVARRPLRKASLVIPYTLAPCPRYRRLRNERGSGNLGERSERHFSQAALPNHLFKVRIGFFGAPDVGTDRVFVDFQVLDKLKAAEPAEDLLFRVIDLYSEVNDGE